MKMLMVATAVTMLAGTAAAAPTAYTTEAAFLAAASGATFAPTLSFEGPNVNGDPLDFGPVVLTCTTSCSPGSSGRNPTDGVKSISINGANFTLTFDNAVNAVSFDLLGFNSPNLTGTFNGQSFVLVSGNTDQTDGRPGFFGFVDGATAFTSITLSGGLSGDIVYLDRLRFGTIAAVDPGAVPEPATWAMMIAGFGLVGGAMRGRVGGRVRLAV